MKRLISRTIMTAIFLLSGICAGSLVFAQDNVSQEAVNVEQQETEDTASVQAEEKEKKPQRVYKKKFFSDNMPSMFFTYWQQQAIIEAKASKGLVNPPTDWELNSADPDDELLRDPGPREIIVGGIIYKAKDNWTVWLNGQRVTPGAIPKEVLDFNVYESHVEVKWLDTYTGQIFPVRLRAHERFNLDTRMFLPGER